LERRSIAELFFGDLGHPLKLFFKLHSLNTTSLYTWQGFRELPGHLQLQLVVLTRQMANINWWYPSL
jgi:hypothetical protein